MNCAWVLSEFGFVIGGLIEPRVLVIFFVTGGIMIKSICTEALENEATVHIVRHILTCTE